jgi:hypothetical protein
MERRCGHDWNLTTSRLHAQLFSAWSRRVSTAQMNTFPTAGSGEDKALQNLAERLGTHYHLPPEVIDAEIALALSDFTASKVRDFVPVLVEREVLDRVRQTKRSEPAL